MEGDGGKHTNVVLLVTISIHALRVEGDEPSPAGIPGALVFLSTPSVWRATVLDPEKHTTDIEISIHALRVEGDFSAPLAAE